MANFIPHEIKRIVPRDPPWITKPLKTMLKRKNRLFKNYKRHGYTPVDKVRLDNFRKECQEAVENVKLNYLTNMGNELNNPNTNRKAYWKIINKVMNKCKAPKIPPLLVNNLFILNCREKANLSTDFFSHQCKPVINHSILPNFNYLTNEKIEQIPRGVFSIFLGYIIPHETATFPPGFSPIPVQGTLEFRINGGGGGTY